MARGSGIGADHRLLVSSPVNLAIDSKHLDGNFQHDGVHVEAGYSIGSVIVSIISILRCRQHAADSHAEVEGVEGRAQVDVERIIHSSREDANIVAQVVNCLVEQRLVIRHSPRAHVGWNREQRLPIVQASGFSVLDHGYGVILEQAQTFGACSVQRRDRRDTSNASHQCSEQVGLTEFGGETELEDYVFHPVLVVVYPHFIEHIGIEGKIVGAIRWLEERINVEDHGDPVRVIVADKGVPVGDVRGTIECRNRSFAMAGRKQAGRYQHEQRHGEGHH